MNVPGYDRSLRYHDLGSNPQLIGSAAGSVAAGEIGYRPTITIVGRKAGDALRAAISYGWAGWQTSDPAVPGLLVRPRSPISADARRQIAIVLEGSTGELVIWDHGSAAMTWRHARAAAGERYRLSRPLALGILLDREEPETIAHELGIARGTAKLLISECDMAIPHAHREALLAALDAAIKQGPQP